MSLQTEQFTPSEAAAFVDLPEKQVRKEIEYKVIQTDSPPRLPFSALVYLFLVRRSTLTFRVQDRIMLYRRIAETLDVDEIPEEIEIVFPFYLRLGSEVDHLRNKIIRFMEWKETLVEDPEIMGGAVVFPNSRLTVRHVGAMAERGIEIEEIMEDYPYLTKQDIEFASIFVRAYSQLGRPVGGE